MELVPFLVALVGLAVAALRAYQVSILNIDAEAFGSIVEKCLRMRDPVRARKLCAVAPETPLAAGTAAMIEDRALPHGTTEDDARAMLRDAFIASFGEKATPIVAGRFGAWLAFLLLVGPVARASFAAALDTKLLVVATLGLGLLGWTALSAAKTLASGPRVLDRLLPHALPLVLEPVSTYRAPETGELDAPESKPTAARPDSVVVTIECDGASEGTQVFDQPIIKIGRTKTAHLHLDDESVGRMHAVIERDEGAVSIIDLGNASGTLVNGERVNKAKLSHGDVVGIGSYRLTIGLGAKASSVAGPSRETDDPKTWGHLAAVFYGFEHRSPDLFYDVVAACIASRARIAKLRRKAGSPRFVVAVLANGVDELAATRRRIEQNAPSLYPSYATPAAEIAPDAIYGAETSTQARLLAELVAGETEILATRAVTMTDASGAR